MANHYQCNRSLEYSIFLFRAGWIILKNQLSKIKLQKLGYQWKLLKLNQRFMLFIYFRMFNNGNNKRKIEIIFLSKMRKLFSSPSRCLSFFFSLFNQLTYFGVIFIFNKFRFKVIICCFLF